MSKDMEEDMALLEKYGYKLERIEEFAEETGISTQNLVVSEANRMRANEMRSAGLITFERWVEIMAEIAIIQTPVGVEN